jgi:hypothetical protein
MFDQFLRGSGFHFEDEEEISATADKTEISGIADDEFDITAVHSPDWDEVRITLTPKNTADNKEIERLNVEVKRLQDLADYRLKLLMQMPENKPWVGLTDDDFFVLKANNDYPFHFAKAIEAKLKEKNNG